MKLRQTIFFTVALLILTTSLGCQNTKILTDQERQVKIETMYRQYAAQFPQVKGITVTELQQLQQKQQLVLIDVRTPEEIAVSQIPGAITAEEYAANLEQYQDLLAIAYCTIGYRSGLYAQKLAQQGIEVLNLEGSLLAWSHTGGELVNAEGATNKVHIFGRQWRLTAENYEAVW
ncbi:MAG: rhodanese-like domain-containing protein [Cyanobacteria bacterium P01_C01_bin.72]